MRVTRGGLLIALGVIGLGWIARPGPRLFGLHVDEVILQRPGRVAAYRRGGPDLPEELPREIPIKDPAGIARFVPAVHARKYQSCGCAHLDRMLFRTDICTFDASVCDHCLDFQNMLPGHCVMPAGLYARVAATWDSLDAVAASGQPAG